MRTRKQELREVDYKKWSAKNEIYTKLNNQKRLAMASWDISISHKQSYVARAFLCHWKKET